MDLEEGHFAEMVGVPRTVFLKLASYWERHIATRMIGAPFGLTSREQVLLFFTRLRHYPVHSFASHIFNTSTTTAYNTTLAVTEFFFNFFLSFVNIGTIQTRLFDSFRYYHHVITFILDGTEQEIHSTANIYREGQYYSTKKGQHSITILLIISPSKRILYLSPCMYGSINDDEMLMLQRSVVVLL